MEDLVSAVRVKLDEIGLNDSEFAPDVDTSGTVADKDEEELDTIIKSCFDEAVRYVFTNADTNLLEANHEQEFEYDEGGEEGAITPELSLEVEGTTEGASIAGELYRLVYGKLDCWARAVERPIFWTDKEYARLEDPLAMGTPERPEIGIRVGRNFSSKKKEYVLTFYSAKDTAGFGVLSLLVHPKADENGQYSIPDRLVPALVWYMAGQTLTTLRDQHAEAMFQQALLAMGRQDKVSDTGPQG